MTLLAVLEEDKYLEMPEALKKEYVQGEDKRYYLDVSPVDGWGFENTGELKKALKSERNLRAKYEKQYNELNRKFEGISPEDLERLPELESLKAKLDEMKNWTPEERVAERIRDLESNYKKKLEELKSTLEGQVQEKDAKIRQLVVDTRARKALASVECLDPDLFLPKISSSCEIDEEGNVWPVDSQGNRLQSTKPGKVGDMDLVEWCENLRKQHPRNFKGTDASGGGSEPGGAGGPSKFGSEAFKSLPPEDRLKAIRANSHV